MTARNTKRTDEVHDQAAAQANDKLMSFKVTATGSPLSILFAGEGRPDMKDTAYRVSVHNEAQNVSLDESTLATTGFDILGGTGAEIVHIIIHGDIDE